MTVANGGGGNNPKTDEGVRKVEDVYLLQSKLPWSTLAIV